MGNYIKAPMHGGPMQEYVPTAAILGSTSAHFDHDMVICCNDRTEQI